MVKILKRLRAPQPASHRIFASVLLLGYCFGISACNDGSQGPQAANPTRSSQDNVPPVALSSPTPAITLTPGMLKPLPFPPAPREQMAGEAANRLIIFGGIDDPMDRNMFEDSMAGVAELFRKRQWQVLPFFGSRNRVGGERLAKAMDMASGRIPISSKAELYRALDDAAGLPAGSQVLLWLMAHGSPGRGSSPHSILVSASAGMLSNIDDLKIDDPEFTGRLSVLKHRRIRLAVIDDTCFGGASVPILREYGCILASQTANRISRNYSGPEMALARTYWDNLTESELAILDGSRGTTMEDLYLNNLIDRNVFGSPVISSASRRSLRLTESGAAYFYPVGKECASWNTRSPFRAICEHEASAELYDFEHPWDSRAVYDQLTAFARGVASNRPDNVATRTFEALALDPMVSGFGDNPYFNESDGSTGLVSSRFVESLSSNFLQNLDQYHRRTFENFTPNGDGFDDSVLQRRLQAKNRREFNMLLGLDYISYGSRSDLSVNEKDARDDCSNFVLFGPSTR